MASVEYQHSILWRGEDPSKRKFKPALDRTTRIARYRAGQAPTWADKEDEDEPAEQKPQASSSRKRRRASQPQVLEDATVSRLKRLAAAHGTNDPLQERMLRHRVVHEAMVLEASKKAEDDEKEDEDGALKLEVQDDLGRQPVAGLAYDEVSGSEEDELEIRELRRERARELALQRRKEEEELLLQKEEDLDDEVVEDADLEEDEDDVESEDEDPRRHVMLKPVFVPKSQRETVKEKEQVQKDEELAKEREKYKLQERKVESKQLLVDQIRQDEEGVNENDASDAEMPDDNDEVDEEHERELWKIRELRRIKRDLEERKARQMELEYIERRRNMTEEERAADDKRLDEGASKRDEVKQFSFMQKYYHRGGFFQDKAASGTEPLYLRDYHEPLEEEKFDKNLLPQAMQLRRGQFGKKGQVKHTHLTAVDTTDKTAAWAQSTKQVQRYQEKMAGVKGATSFSRPSATSRPGG